MEKTKKTNLTEEVISKTDGGEGWGAGCPFWIIGDEKSADADLKEKFEIVNEKKD